jgi:hypothetical protein
MKRCPQCLFLYPDADERCDFDTTVLEVVDEATIEAATNPGKPRVRRSRTIPIAIAAAVGGLLLAVVVLAVYFGVGRQKQEIAAAPSAATPPPVSSPQTVLPEASPSPSPSPEPEVSPSPSASPAPTQKTSSNGVSTSHSRATIDPVSTSGPGIGTRQGAKPVIVLTSGGKIEADEVWRTKDGVWYRRNGIVTLLKRAQVKAIVTR